MMLYIQVCSIGYVFDIVFDVRSDCIGHGRLNSPDIFLNLLYLLLSLSSAFSHIYCGYYYLLYVLFDFHIKHIHPF